MNGREHEQHEGERRADETLLRRAMPGLPPDVEVGRPRPFRPEEREGDEERPEPQIYVASLSDYNAGRLHGRWIDADQPLDAIWSEIHGMLAESREPLAEEWAIHDYEGFWPLRLREYESLEFVREVAEGIAEHGEAFAAFAAEVVEHDADGLFLFEQLYKGKWGSVEAFAESLVEGEGVQATLDELPEWVRPYVSVDYVGLAQGLQSGGVIAREARDGGVYVFDLE